MKEIITKRTNAELIKDWTLLDSLEVTPEVAMVRGWMMDEIEKRWPQEFDNWMENCDTNDNIENYIKL